MNLHNILDYFKKNNIKMLLLAIFIICITTRYIVIPRIKYDNICLKKLLNDDDIRMISECFDKKDKKALECYKIRQTIIFDKLKRELGVKYLKVDHARWSDGTQNFDAGSYHRDIKPYAFNSEEKYPNVYTLVCFLDDSEHTQGGVDLQLNRGDCLLFNSFNLHKGKNLKHLYNKKSKRRVLQFFHIFLDKDEYNNFTKKHSYTEHVHIDSNILKYINSYVDLRPELEYYNLFNYFAAIKRNNNKDIKYLTFISKKNKIGKINGITYYKQF